VEEKFVSCMNEEEKKEKFVDDSEIVIEYEYPVI